MKQHLEMKSCKLFIVDELDHACNRPCILKALSKLKDLSGRRVYPEIIFFFTYVVEEDKRDIFDQG